MGQIFDTDKRIRLGVWGCGRGGGLIGPAKLFNIDVVAGCDIHPEILGKFKENVPDAFCTNDENEFLKCDMDAVLIATYLPDHVEHAIRALEAGKHVMCEVTAFQCPGDAVRLIEAVEKSGKVYNLLENYPFTRENMYLQRLYKEGFFGEYLYGEFEYLHECRCLAYGYNTRPISIPVEPGYHVHNWRSGLNHHVYCTHSLGPAMYITGLRPVSVSALSNEVKMPGILSPAPRAVSPSIIKMSNGALLRNLMGTSSNDYSNGMRMWGTRAAAEKLRGHGSLRIRTGSSGSCGNFYDINAAWDKMGEEAEKTGHGGGDFWELYYFARQVFTGEKAPWDIYSACDVTMAGLMAIRSAERNGEAVTIPNLRDPAVRDQYRNDFRKPESIDCTAVFPEGHDPKITGSFTTVMTKLLPLMPSGGLPLFFNVIDGMKIYDQISNVDGKLKLRNDANRLIKELPELSANALVAKKIMEAYPDSIAGKTIANLFNMQEIEKLFNVEETIAEIRQWQDNHC